MAHYRRHHMDQFRAYLMDDVKKSLGDEPDFTYECVEPRLAAALIEAALAAGLRAEITAQIGNLADVTVRQG
jgi:hypothetical protein